MFALAMWLQCEPVSMCTVFVCKCEYYSGNLISQLYITPQQNSRWTSCISTRVILPIKVKIAFFLKVSEITFATFFNGICNVYVSENTHKPRYSKNNTVRGGSTFCKRRRTSLQMTKKFLHKTKEFMQMTKELALNITY